ncbi:TRAP transporter large permease [Anaerotruncus rubiinfantis]|uniref:TRAP transporter large permease n=1 Tax=Anaerotruncus rubiinfantis TaxID=1720200 RepID=UPI00189AB8E0|nr:TRAP transporter large permease [Anaerotruncus rubiinfantis]
MNLSVLIPVLVIIALMLMEAPIWVALVGGMLPYFLFLGDGLPTQILMQRFVATTESSSYLAVPFFITAGAIMNRAGLSEKLLDFADALVGHLRGGLAHVNILLSVLMGGVSGSAAADAAMESKILVPEMERRGYSTEFSAAVTVASSLITPIIPPGMGLIIYAMAANVSVGRIFSAGYVPGVLCMIGFMIYVHFYAKKHNYTPSREKMASFKEIFKLLRHAIWALLMPLGLLMALRAGMLTASETGAACCAYSLFIGTVVYHKFKKEDIIPTIIESVIGTASVMTIMCAANILAYFLSYENIPRTLTALIVDAGVGKAGYLLIVNIFVFILGMFVSNGMIPILATLLAPIAISLGIDPVHFGIVIVFGVTIGNMTPPFGLVLYQVAGLTKCSVVKLAKECLPFIAIMVLVLMVITYSEPLTLLIPNLIYG